ncbi:uncharacterized protein [Panulirus ornatus]|uniref:uncharacterized protein n=1 Tax=Panulirus ornatus TaxID=150431 RepID=UPI003A8AF22C
MSDASQDNRWQLQPSAPPTPQPEPNSKVQYHPQEQCYPPPPYTPPPYTQQPHQPPSTQKVEEYRPTPTAVAAEKPPVVVAQNTVVVKEKGRSCPQRKGRLGLRLALGLATGGTILPLMMRRRHRRRRHNHE